MIIETTFVQMWVKVVKIMSLHLNISRHSSSLSTCYLTLNSDSSCTPLPLWMLGGRNGEVRWPTMGWWVTILFMVGDRPRNGGWPSLEWCVTVLGRVGDHPWDGGWPTRGWCVPIVVMVGDHPRESGWPSCNAKWLSGVTIQGMLGDSCGDGGWRFWGR